jgi:pteridine reductase
MPLLFTLPNWRASLDDWDDLMISNARAPFFLSQALNPAITRSHGSIVNIVDIHANARLNNIRFIVWPKLL